MKLTDVQKMLLKDAVRHLHGICFAIMDVVEDKIEWSKNKEDMETDKILNSIKNQIDLTFDRILDITFKPIK